MAYNAVTHGVTDITIDGKTYEVGESKVSIDFAPWTVTPAGGSNHATKVKKQQTIDVTAYRGLGFDLAAVLGTDNATVRFRSFDGHVYELQHARRVGDAKIDMSTAESPLSFSAGAGNAYVDGVKVI